MSCFDDCKALYDAYLKMLAGQSKVEVRYNDMWVQYRANTAGDMDRLRMLYSTLRQQCPQALCELPDLSPALRVRRGPPVGIDYGC